MSCEPCGRALTVRHHEYANGCTGCIARAMARAPDFIRLAYLEKLPEDERTSMVAAARAAWLHDRGRTE